MVNWIPRLEFFAQSLFFSQRQCPHCRSDDCATLAKKYGSIRVKQCSRCRLCFTSPIYRTRLFPSLYGCVYHAEGSTTTPPAVEQLAFWKEEGFKSSDKNFTKVVEDLAKLCSNGDRRLLEIGCSWGYFLHQAARGGFKVTGIEVNETLASYGREHLGVPIFKNFLEMKGGLFDLVFSWHALEHFTDLSRIFWEISEHLKPGGKLFIAVPNFDWDRFGDKCLSWIGAVHPLGFSAPFFAHSLPQYGFVVKGLYEDLADFPDRPSPAPSKGGLIVWAEKSGR